VLPKKLVITGTYQAMGHSKCPFVVLFDRVNKTRSQTRVFSNKEKITSIGYGPFDNGHVVVGLSTGALVGYSGIDMSPIFSLRVFDRTAISSITFDPTNLILVSSESSGEIAAVSLIENKVKYMYAEIGPKKYFTIITDTDTKRVRGKSVPPPARS